MAASRESGNGKRKTVGKPATTPEEVEDYNIGLAVSLASRQLQDGTASAQVITHYLKLGSSRERLEQERLQMEVDLMGTKKQILESEARVEELVKDAMDAMKTYRPTDTSGEEEEYYD